MCLQPKGDTDSQARNTLRMDFSKEKWISGLLTIDLYVCVYI